jgi:hypothetical protein
MPGTISCAPADIKELDMQAETLLSQLAAPRDVRQLPVAAMHAVFAMRLCVLCQSVDRDPVDELTKRLGNSLAARRFLLVFEMIGAAWPGAFTIARPCCLWLTCDEIALAEMMTAAAMQNRASFDRSIEEMLGEDARERLFAGLAAFDRARTARLN